MKTTRKPPRAARDATIDHEPVERPLTRAELTAFLGISMATLKRELVDARFPRFYVGKRERFSPREVLRFYREKSAEKHEAARRKA